MDGTWNLEVNTPSGTHPATLTFERTNGALTGHMNSRLGNVPLTDLTTTDEGFDARVALDFQGRTFQADINGRVNDNRLDGTIKVGFPMAPTIRFTGTRAA